MTPTEIWPMIAGSAFVVFGAGQLVEKIRTSRIDEIQKRLNGTYIKAELCAAFRKTEDERWVSLEKTISKLDAWVEKQRDS